MGHELVHSLANRQYSTMTLDPAGLQIVHSAIPTHRGKETREPDPAFCPAHLLFL